MIIIIINIIINIIIFIIKILLLLLLFILLYILNNNIFELFNPLYFRFDPSLTTYLKNKKCNPGNNCFPGSYWSSQYYQNVCQPKYGLYRQKIGLQDNCLRNLNKSRKLVCPINNHLLRDCFWNN